MYKADRLNESFQMPLEVLYEKKIFYGHAGGGPPTFEVEEPKHKGSQRNLACLLLAWRKTPCQLMSLYREKSVLGCPNDFTYLSKNLRALTSRHLHLYQVFHYFLPSLPIIFSSTVCVLFPHQRESAPGMWESTCRMRWYREESSIRKKSG